MSHFASHRTKLFSQLKLARLIFPPSLDAWMTSQIRNVNHVKDCALVGADVITAPPKVVKSLSNHILTDKGLAAFLKDWEGTGQSI